MTADVQEPAWLSDFPRLAATKWRPAAYQSLPVPATSWPGDTTFCPTRGLALALRRRCWLCGCRLTHPSAVTVTGSLRFRELELGGLKLPVPQRLWPSCPGRVCPTVRLRVEIPLPSTGGAAVGCSTEDQRPRSAEAHPQTPDQPRRRAVRGRGCVGPPSHAPPPSRTGVAVDHSSGGSRRRPLSGRFVSITGRRHDIRSWDLLTAVATTWGNLELVYQRSAH